MPEPRSAQEQLAALNQRVRGLYLAGKTYEAGQFAEDAFILSNDVDTTHPEVGKALENLALIYRDEGSFVEAEQMTSLLLLYREELLGGNHPDVAAVLNSLALLQGRLGKFAEAEALFSRAIAILEMTLGPEHPCVGTALGNLAMMRFVEGRHAEAHRMRERAWSISRKALVTAGRPGKTVVDEIEQLKRDVQQLTDDGRYADASDMARKRYALIERGFGPVHPVLVSVLRQLSKLYEKQGQTLEAETASKRATALEYEMIGPDRMSGAAITMDRVAALEHQLHSVDQALARVQQINRQNAAATNRMIGIAELGSLKEKVDRLYREGKYLEAAAVAERAVELCERFLESDHPDLAAALNDLAANYECQGRYDAAAKLYMRAIAIWERSLGPNHPHVGLAAGNLAVVYSTMGRYPEAEPLVKRDLAITQQALGKSHASVAAGLGNLARLYLQQGRYADSELLLKQASAIVDGGTTSDEPAVSTAANNLASVFHRQGRYAEAERLYKRCVAIREATVGKDHLSVATVVGNLAVLHAEEGRFAEAEQLAKRVVAIKEKMLGPDHVEVALAVGNLASILERRLQHREARQLQQRSVAVLEAAVGSDHPSVANALNNLAESYQHEGQFKKAELLQKRVIGIFEKTLGGDHPHMATALNNLAVLYQMQGRLTEAEALQRQAESLPGWEVIDVPVLFATNRGQLSNLGQLSYGAEQRQELSQISFGKAVVRAPASVVVGRGNRLVQSLGQLDRAVGPQTLAGGLAVRTVEPDRGDAAFAAVTRDRLARAARFPGQAFVFVHGYNNSFEDAVRRTAMIAFDLDFDGMTFLFTWPSQGSLTGYGVDRKRARIAAPFLLALLERIGALLPTIKLHLLAHSTGGEIVLSALEDLSKKDGAAPRPKFGELILAHADVDPARLVRIMPHIRALGMGVTSYSSATDWAMRLSRWARLRGERVGSAPVYTDGVDAIDITGLSAGGLALNHTVFVENPLVFGDMARLMSSGLRPPDKRTDVFKPVNSSRGTHWEWSPGKA